MAELQVFSTAGLAPHRRLDYWNAHAGDALTHLVADPLNDPAEFCGRLALAEIGTIRLAEVYSDPAIVRHTRRHIEAMQEGKFFLCLQLDGVSVNRQQGREAVLRCGDFTLFDSAFPYEVSFRDPNRMLVLCIPHEALLRRIASPEAIVAHAMPGDREVSGLLSSLVRSFWSQGGPEMQLGPRFSEAILDLIATAYAPLSRATAEVSPLCVARREQVRAFIEEHLEDPRLTPSSVARALRMSPRYLHQVFNEGETVARYILRRRLEECARSLKDPAQRGRTVTEIAFQHGFNDASHFSRAFRERYDETPREYRRPARSNSPS
ncbi:MAG TPA: helix-turn-helix domain-containing protein [Steroidobacteraceae bacterium]|nr:helix-turn-helix domain-containing protein [Steroidobacteraceae bacterium]